MSLIDDKKNSSADVLIKIKFFLINISISLAVYILIFIIGSLTMFACNISEAKILDKTCPDDGRNPLENVAIPINVISDNNIIKKYLHSKFSDEIARSANMSHDYIDDEYIDDDYIADYNDDEFKRFLNKDDNKVTTGIFQILESNKSNAEKLLFCVDENENKNFGIFKNSLKYTINFIYSLIKLYSTFLNRYMSEIFILWISPLFSLLFFIFLGVITGAYFYYKLIIISVENIYKKMFNNFFTEPWLSKLKQIVISNIIIIGAIILAIFGFLFSPIISFVVVMYAIFNILTQKLKKKESELAITEDDYGIFQKMADNLIYKKGYNIIIILILSIINVFLFDSSICGIIIGLIIIFYFIFYKKLNLHNIPFSNFHNILIKKNETVELG